MFLLLQKRGTGQTGRLVSQKKSAKVKSQNLYPAFEQLFKLNLKCGFYISSYVCQGSGPLCPASVLVSSRCCFSGLIYHWIFPREGQADNRPASTHQAGTP
jgi:hypothetical protein